MGDSREEQLLFRNCVSNRVMRSLRWHQFISWRMLRGMLRDVVFCVLLPSVVLLSAYVVAQKTVATAAPQQSQQQSDDQLADVINTKLMASSTLRPLDLGVWVHEGIATLSGTVPSRNLQRQADALARSVPGVQSVDDQITIGTSLQDSSQEPPAEASASTPQQTQEQDPAQAGYQEETPAPNTPSYSTEAPPAGNDAGSGGPGQNSSVRPPSVGNPPPGSYGNGNTGNPSYAQNAPSNAPPNVAQLHRSQMQNDQPKMTIAQGTPLRVQVLQTLDSQHSTPGTAFRGVLAQDVMVNGLIALPRGALIDGTVVDARAPEHLKGSPKLALQVSNVSVGNASYVLTTQAWEHQGPGKGGQTAGTIAGSAAVGALVGGAVGGGPIALLGAAIGGLGGAGLSALSPGARVFVPAESVITFRLTAPLTVREPTVADIRSLAANAPPAPPARQYRRAYYPYPPPPPPPPPYYYPY